MKATKSEIEQYILHIFLSVDLDWNGYMALKKHEKNCIEKGEIIWL